MLSPSQDPRTARRLHDKHSSRAQPLDATKRNHVEVAAPDAAAASKATRRPAAAGKRDAARGEEHGARVARGRSDDGLWQPRMLKTKGGLVL